MNIKLSETRNTKKPEAIDNESIEMGCGAIGQGMRIIEDGHSRM